MDKLTQAQINIVAQAYKASAQRCSMLEQRILQLESKQERTETDLTSWAQLSVQLQQEWRDSSENIAADAKHLSALAATLTSLQTSLTEQLEVLRATLELQIQGQSGRLRQVEAFQTRLEGRMQEMAKEAAALDAKLQTTLTLLKQSSANEPKLWNELQLAQQSFVKKLESFQTSLESNKVDLHELQQLNSHAVLDKLSQTLSRVEAQLTRSSSNSPKAPQNRTP